MGPAQSRKLFLTAAEFGLRAGERRHGCPEKAQFPATRGYAYTVLLWVWQPLISIVHGILGYLPNLVYILVIAAVTRLILHAVDFVFRQTERGVISLAPWIHQDVARPTSQILRWEAPSSITAHVLMNKV